MSAAIAATAGNVAAAYLGTAPQSRERLITEDIFAVWIGQAAQEVRETLSRKLRDCPHLPRKLAIKIAEDVEPVAVPILLSSEVFTDDDLCALAREGRSYHLIALAQRDFVPHVVSEALVETGREDVVMTLLGNAGAKLSEPTLHRIIDCFTDRAWIHAGLVERAVLPASVGDRLLTVVAKPLRDRLIERFRLPIILAGEAAGSAGNTEPASPTGSPADTGAGQKLVDYLHGVHRLTPTFLMRALCDGKIDIFEAGLKSMAHLPRRQVHDRLRADDREARIELFVRAGIPRPMTPALHAAADIIINGTVELHEADKSRERTRGVIAQMILVNEDTNRVSIEAVLNRLYGKIEDAFLLRSNNSQIDGGNTVH